MPVTLIKSIADFTAAVATKERVLISFTLENSSNPQNDSCEAINPLFDEISGSNPGVKFYKVIINVTPDVSQKAGVDMMLLPSYKLYKDGAGPVKTAQGPSPATLFEIIAEANA